MFDRTFILIPEDGREPIFTVVPSNMDYMVACRRAAHRIWSNGNLEFQKIELSTGAMQGIKFHA